MELISFVILHFGDIQVTKSCIQSILNMQHQDQIRIIVVDNDIKKPSSERKKLQEYCKTCQNVQVIQNNKNGGFSYANNLGYRYAREQQKASFILILNNDIEFLQKDFVERLHDAYKNHPCHILGPDIVRAATQEHQNPMDTRIRTKEEAEYTIRMNQVALKYFDFFYPVLYLKNKYEEKKSLKQKKINEAYYSTIQKNIVPFGACFIFTPKFVQNEEKAFEPETEFYYEEYILTLRCQRKGYQIVYDPSLKLLHESGAATKKNYSDKKQHLKFMMNRIKEASAIYLDYLTGIN